jgi:hypothetical protein
MTRFLLALVLTLIPLASFAEAVKVTSGEHDSFTRLVVELPVASDWLFGRTANGYEFTVPGTGQPRYDLTRVWERIPRDRLSALWADPESGHLKMSLACACHAFPFELRPGVIVIDLRDGAAPKESAFEKTLDGSSPAPLMAAKTAPRPQPRTDPKTNGQSYDWLAVGEDPERSSAEAAPLSPTPPISLGPARDALLQEMGRGFAAGVIDIADPGKGLSVADAVEGIPPWSRISIGEMPGISAGAARIAEGSMQPNGDACIPDETLDVAAWGTDQPGALQLAEARADMFGEFDVPDREAITQTVRRHVFLGFGAEALQYLSLLESGAAEGDLKIYASMAKIVDGQEDPASPFRPMLGCDTAAALWAALLYTDFPTTAEINDKAILRAFEALPPHLRQAFGPGLAERFLGAGNTEAVRKIRASIARVKGTPEQQLSLIDARVDLTEGQAEAAKTTAEAALLETGDKAADPLMTLVEAGFQKMEPLSPEIAETLRAYLRDGEGTDKEAALRRGLVLALALSGRPEEASTELSSTPETANDLWQVIGQRAEDVDFLALAVTNDPPPRDELAESTALPIAQRLYALGFPDAALAWLGQVEISSPPEIRFLAAQAEFARGDARRARDLLSGLDHEDASVLRALSLAKLGQTADAVEVLQAAGDSERALRLTAWQRDWDALSRTDGTPWADTARLATEAKPDKPTAEGMLAQGEALVVESGAARQAISDLLAAFPPPAELP